MIAYKGSFIKKDDTIRDMVYVKVSDLPSEFLAEKLGGGSGSSMILPDGQELVFDIESEAFRIFNHNTSIKPIQKIEIEDGLFL